MAQATKLTDLPSDVLYAIFPYLSVSEYLNLTTCTRAFSVYREDPHYWRVLTRKTFRIPDQPLLQKKRWFWLYKNLLTQTRLYTWGSNKCGNLGHERISEEARRPAPQGARRHTFGIGIYEDSGWPKQALIDERVGIVADVQCGGWSTTVLNSVGAIYMVGIFYPRIPEEDDGRLRRLSFPPAYPETTKIRYEPNTAIQQYSTGRFSVLGLADDGKVWMWDSNVGFQIKLMHVDLVQNRVERVVAGWNCSSIYAVNVGIVYWASFMDSDVVRGRRQELLIVADMMLADSFTIPGTGYRRKKHESLVEGSLESRIGEVTGHVVLEKYIVFITDLNKVFCYPISAQTPALDVSDPLELTSFYTASPTESFGIRDIQGAFTRFAVFTQEGCVLTASQDLLDAFWESYRTRSDDSSLTSPSADLIPSLQARGVMSIAFGDHHFLALSSNGNVTAYGKESESCGALGLGETTSKLRGMIIGLGGRDTNRLPEGEGRTVWFEPLMATWLTDMQRQGAIKGEGRERAVMLKAGDEVYRKAYADYFGKEGAKWEEKVTQEGEMGAYFVLKVAAAGWSSAALVLVDEEKAERARESHRVHPPPKRPPPSPTLSMQSNDSYEHIDSPGEQLTNAVYAIYEWIWRLGRSFLGLTKRDVRRETEREQGCEEGYVWSKEPFPRLRLPDRRAMPGDIPLTE